MLMIASIYSFVTLYIKVSYNAREYNVRIFKTKPFAKFAEKQKISDEQLIWAIQRAEQGLIDANLGSNIIKQRVARQAQGRSSGYRVLIFYKIRDNHFFVAGYAKNEQENLSDSELKTLKQMVSMYENYAEEKLNLLCAKGILIEIITGE
ncbi:type II toxin-antitoxin system RelE/ParE family toxin [Bibersteinia trehalosi]|uniref:type II toxin-antitoxin system RelE/ParE family toxin n=1 Tax=Bibersteinia trehalosi TaxID=47735 RepID=UPI001E61F04B|nr:type II toxin-antitoxin system RelE/ParE family toxin [Bibersteinia trehalosi]